ncbi:MAG TPA: hypothetical protein VFR84_01205 [Candidatus Angelobacter sp.]|nr:hypothetical protein [Candidatus Angelobacter sp.]
MVSAIPAHAGANFDLVTAPGGITLTQVGNNYIASFGTMNGLGIGTPAAGVTVIPLSNGSLYLTSYSLFVHGGLAAGQTGFVTAYASTNFAHPIALVLQSCPSSSSCNAANQFSNLSTNVGAQTTVIAPPGIAKGATVNAGLAIFVPDNNGGNAFNGTDQAVISFTMFNNNTGATIETLTLSLNNPRETLQSAVSLTLASAAGGLSITPGADYAMNFGNVNGLGFGPGAGLTVSAAAGGVVYSTPYLLQPSFSDQSNTTATLNVFVRPNFAHPAALALRDATSSTGPFTTIGTSPGGAVVISTTAANRSTITRFLGLFVSNVNGATAFAGTDAATLIFTITVP